MPDSIYFDNNATTQPLDEVVQAMQRALREDFANPSSVHRLGQAVRHRVETARAQVAELINAQPQEIVFTSGGTESINLALRGLLSWRSDRRHLVTTAVEHSAVRILGQQLAREGYALDEVRVDRAGCLDPAELEARVTEQTALVSIQWANNETGVLCDVEGAARIAAARGVPLHIDAVQAVGKVPIDVSRLPVHLLSLSGHKFHGPKGVGALFVSRSTRIRPLILGGQQERGRRGGTENVAGIVGLGVASAAARADLATYTRVVGALRDRLEEGICRAVPAAVVNAQAAPRLANTANVAFRALQAEAILLLLSESGVCASAGAACSSGSLEPSHVLLAMGLEPELAHGSVRFSLSKFNTAAEIDRVVELLPGIVGRLQGISVPR